MESKEIIEDNRLIAEFMGWIHSEDREYDKHEMENLKYHSSWNWLMPACRKFKDLDIDQTLYASHMQEIDIRIVDEYDIRSAHFALVEGIKWYNSQPVKHL